MELTRRGFFASLAALAALPATIHEWPAASVQPALDSALDALNTATMRHIRKSPLYVDRMFTADPLLRLAHREYPKGRVVSFPYIASSE